MPPGPVLLLAALARASGARRRVTACGPAFEGTGLGLFTHELEAGPSAVPLLFRVDERGLHAPVVRHDQSVRRAGRHEQ
jgi:hypothetical protein